MSESKMSNGTKLALGLGAVAGVGVFLFSRSSKASEGSTKSDTADADAKILADAAAKGCSDGAADKAAGKPSKVAATTGFETSPSTASGAYDKAYASCYGLGTVPVTGAPPVVVPPPKPATIIFSPEKVKDGARAASLAYAIRHSPPVGVSVACVDPMTPGGKSYCSLSEFARTGLNSAAIAAFQDAAGITPDGFYGSQTQRAFDYFNHDPYGPTAPSV